ncbi:MAG: purine-nucleoside phosphorylase [Actinobacteria bacterium]|nr:purine-nucleoside phosphorylase [Actinomycetota bacterium]
MRDARAAADAVAAATGVASHDVAIVLGSGWVDAVSDLDQVGGDVPLASLPGFAAPTAVGHGASLRSLRAGDVKVLAFTGRSHFYESRDVDLVAHAVRTAAAAGCRAVVLTSASGGIADELAPGDIVLISDHVNLTGESPLVGANFVDLTDLYSARLREICRDIDPALPSAVYAGYWGPNYETPAEIRAYKTLGADIVGMSTVLEAIAAHAAGMEVLGISLVTNRAAGLGGRLDHAEVLETAAASVERMRALLIQLLPRLSPAT